MTNDKETLLEGAVAAVVEDVRPLLADAEDVLAGRHTALGALLALEQADVRHVLRVDVELLCGELGEGAAVHVGRHAHGLVAAVAQVHTHLGAARHGRRSRCRRNARRAVQLRLSRVGAINLFSRPCKAKE